MEAYCSSLPMARGPWTATEKRMREVMMTEAATLRDLSLRMGRVCLAYLELHLKQDSDDPFAVLVLNITLELSRFFMYHDKPQESLATFHAQVEGFRELETRFAYRTDRMMQDLHDNKWATVSSSVHMQALYWQFVRLVVAFLLKNTNPDESKTNMCSHEYFVSAFNKSQQARGGPDADDQCGSMDELRGRFHSDTRSFIHYKHELIKEEASARRLSKKPRVIPGVVSQQQRLVNVVLELLPDCAFKTLLFGSLDPVLSMVMAAQLTARVCLAEPSLREQGAVAQTLDVKPHKDTEVRDVEKKEDPLQWLPAPVRRAGPKKEHPDSKKEHPDSKKEQSYVSCRVVFNSQDYHVVLNTHVAFALFGSDHDAFRPKK